MEQSLIFVLLGKKGAGKSASGNTILGRQAFTSDKSFKSVTPDVVKESGMVTGQQITIYDTPGFCEPEMGENKIQQILNKKVFQKCEAGVCVFLLVIEADRFTADDKETLKKFEKLLGEKRFNQTWILITRGDKLKTENKTIKEFLEENKSLKELIQKYSQRYHVFDNENQSSSEQARILLTKIIQKSLGLKASDGGRLLRQIPNNAANTDDEQQTADGGVSCIRIVLLGKTGVGKSAAGNTILGEEAFESKLKSISITKKCSETHTTISDREVSVVDTPGLFDTNIKHVEFMTEIARTIYLSSPGPHAFLIVLVIDRFTEQEKQIYDLIEIMFGEQVLKYAIILFTHGDKLEGESIETFINENCALRQIVQECGERYHVLDNKQKNNRQQVSELLQKIDTMIEQNGGGHYSNEMFEDAQRFRQEEEHRKKREEEEIKANLCELEIIKAERKTDKETGKQEEKQRQEVAEREEKEMKEREQKLKARQEEFEREEKEMKEREQKLKAKQEEVEREEKERKKREEELKVKQGELERRIKMLQTQRNSEFAEFSRKYEPRFSLAASALGKVSQALLVTTCGSLSRAVTSTLRRPHMKLLLFFTFPEIL